MAPRLRSLQDKSQPGNTQSFRDYSKARPSYVKRKVQRKSNLGLFVQLFAVGAAFTLSFGYVSNEAFRDSVSRAVVSILPEPPAPRSAKDVQRATASIDPFAVSEEAEVLPPKPVSVVVKPLPPPPPPVIQAKKLVPILPPVKAIEPKPPALKPVTQVAALKMVAPPIVAPPKIAPVAAPSPFAVVTPIAPVKVEKPVVAQAVPVPVIQIPAPVKPAKIQERLEAPPVPVEKTVEKLVPQRVQGDVIVDCENCPRLVVVVADADEDAGKAQNASYSGSGEALPPYAIGENEITFDDWDRCVRDGGCTTSPADDGWGRGKRPVIEVSFTDINDQYLPWLSRVSKKTYRLPSEAEWEFAVRGGTNANSQYAYSFGDNEALLCEYGNSSDLAANAADSNWSGTRCNDGFATTAPVASLKPNALGIFDMHGNVWEWVSDCFRSGYSAEPAKNATDCNFRVLRGGSWASPAASLRSAERGWEKPSRQKNSIGFRVARSLP